MTGARMIGTFGLEGAAAIAGVSEAAVLGWGDDPERHRAAFRHAGQVLGRRV